jgi:NAD(P)-dependent dehydrogenase (short-subunit alcohol dehydrogenase family)
MIPRLDGKVILVTGAASGIGLATARLIAECGGIAIASDVAAGADIALDVTDPRAWDDAISGIVSEHGRLDGLVSNAGNMDAGPIVDLDLDAVRRIVRVQVEGAFLGIQKSVAQMRKQCSPAHGSIVATSSIMGSVAMPGVASYGLAKAALSNLVRAIGVELGRKGDFIRVNAVAPGPVRTPLLAGAVAPDYFDDAANFADVPLREVAEPRDVADTIVFLLSDDASFMTSTVNILDGGWGLS